MGKTAASGLGSEVLPSRLMSGDALKLEANGSHGAEFASVHAGGSGHPEAKGEQYEPMCQEAYKKHQKVTHRLVSLS